MDRGFGAARHLAPVEPTGVDRGSEGDPGDDPALADRYAEEIPVLLLNGRVHNIWRVDPTRLRAALLEV